MPDRCHSNKAAPMTRNRKVSLNPLVTLPRTIVPMATSTRHQYYCAISYTDVTFVVVYAPASGQYEASSSQLQVPQFSGITPGLYEQAQALMSPLDDPLVSSSGYTDMSFATSFTTGNPTSASSTDISALHNAVDTSSVLDPTLLKQSYATAAPGNRPTDRNAGKRKRPNLQAAETPPTRQAPAVRKKRAYRPQEGQDRSSRSTFQTSEIVTTPAPAAQAIQPRLEQNRTSGSHDNEPKTRADSPMLPSSVYPPEHWRSELDDLIRDVTRPWGNPDSPSGINSLPPGLYELPMGYEDLPTWWRDL
jgi:hypothetical protein